MLKEHITNWCKLKNLGENIEVDIFFQRILAGQDHLNDHSLILLHRTINTCRTALANLEEDQPRASWCSYLSPMTLFRSVRNAAHQAASALTENTFS